MAIVEANIEIRCICGAILNDISSANRPGMTVISVEACPMCLLAAFEATNGERALEMGALALRVSELESELAYWKEQADPSCS